MSAQAYAGRSPDPTQALRRLVDPDSVAIVGASDRAGSLGARTVSNLLEHSDFRGRPYLINPSRDRVAGRPCFRSITELPEAPDVVLVTVPADTVLPVLRDCAAKGVRYAVVFTSGFGELGEEGRRAQAQMLDLARESGMRLYGPNSPGLCNVNRRLGLSFSPSFRLDQRPGPIGLATQGGGIGRCFLQATERGMGVGLWASTGNEVDLCVADFVRYMADADDITTIVTAMEGIRNGADFIDAALRAADRGKPVIALKVGRSEYGAKAVQSHTGSLSGTAEVNSAALRQAGVIEVDDIDELIDTAALFARRRPAGTERVAVFGFSGGVCALAADAVGEVGLELCRFSDETLDRLRTAMPDYAGISNPVDATAHILIDAEIGYHGLKAVVEDPAADIVLYPFPCDYAELTGRIAETAVRVHRETDTPIVSVWTSDRLGEGWRHLVDGGLVPSRCVKKSAMLIRRWIDHGKWIAARNRLWRPLDLPPRGEPVQYAEPSAKRRLRMHGVESPEGGVAATADAAARIADSLGYPVVAKIVSAQVAHKSDVGGVEVGLADAAAVRAAFDRIVGSVAANAPDVTIDGVLIEQMVRERGFEALVGITRDPVFGPVMTFGLGGLHAEIFKDVSRRLLPVTEREAREMIGEIRSAALLAGYRGRPPADIDALVAALVSLSRFVADSGGQVEEIEINPLWVGEAGRGVVALDCVLSAVAEAHA